MMTLRGGIAVAVVVLTAGMVGAETLTLPTIKCAVK
jgi:hypothetical protein